MKPKNFVIDVDGVMTQPDLIYDEEGKRFKIFGPDDHDALNVLRKYVKIVFLTADKRGLNITRKRIVDEMKFDLVVTHPSERVEWIKKNLEPEETIYMGDGIFDFLVFKEVAYSICPKDGFYRTKKNASFVTQHEGGKRAVAEACVHILEKFFGVEELEYSKENGIWAEEGKK